MGGGCLDCARAGFAAVVVVSGFVLVLVNVESSVDECGCKYLRDERTDQGGVIEWSDEPDEGYFVEAALRAAPPRWITLEVTPPQLGGRRSELSVTLSIVGHAHAAEPEAELLESTVYDKEYISPRELALGQYKMSFARRRTTPSGWVWVLLDGHQNQAGDGGIQRELSRGTIESTAHEVVFLLGAGGGFELLSTDGVASPYAEAGMPALPTMPGTAQHYCADLGRVYGNGPQHFARGCANNLQGFPVTDAFCVVNSNIDGDCAPGSPGCDIDLNACASSCCENCMTERCRDSLREHEVFVNTVVIVLGAPLTLCAIACIVVSCTECKGAKLQQKPQPVILNPQPVTLADLGLHEGVPPKAPPRPKPTFAESAYHKAYDDAPRAGYTTLEMLFRDVQMLIHSHCHHSCGPDQADLLATDLTTRLHRQVQHNALLSQGGEIAKAAMLVWTSNLQLKGIGQDNLQQVTFFMILNDTIRKAGRPDALTSTSSITAAARIARCINELCVAPRPPPGQYDPADNTQRVFRGGGFHPDYKSFYDALSSRGSFDVECGAAKFRIPQYWATSLSEGVAMRFMQSNSVSGHRAQDESTTVQSVLWTISMPADKNMWNAALVESSHFPGEHEYLFVPYSTFTLLKVRWSAGTHTQPHRIDVLASCDNSQESPDLPTAPWA